MTGPRLPKLAPGDRVRVIAPHPEAGAVGEVDRVYRANADYERRARVRFPDPNPGSEIVAARMLEVVR